MIDYTRNIAAMRDDDDDAPLTPLALATSDEGDNEWAQEGCSQVVEYDGDDEDDHDDGDEEDWIVSVRRKYEAVISSDLDERDIAVTSAWRASARQQHQGVWWRWDDERESVAKNSRASAEGVEQAAVAYSTHGIPAVERGIDDNHNGGGEDSDSNEDLFQYSHYLTPLTRPFNTSALRYVDEVDQPSRSRNANSPREAQEDVANGRSSLATDVGLLHDGITAAAHSASHDAHSAIAVASEYGDHPNYIYQDCKHKTTGSYTNPSATDTATTTETANTEAGCICTTTSPETSLLVTPRSTSAPAAMESPWWGQGRPHAHSHSHSYTHELTIGNLPVMGLGLELGMGMDLSSGANPNKGWAAGDRRNDNLSHSVHTERGMSLGGVEMVRTAKSGGYKRNGVHAAA